MNSNQDNLYPNCELKHTLSSIMEMYESEKFSFKSMNHLRQRMKKGYHSSAQLLLSLLIQFYNSCH